MGFNLAFKGLIMTTVFSLAQLFYILTQMIKLYVWLNTRHPQAIRNEKLVYNIYNQIYCQVKPRLSAIFYVGWLNIAGVSW
jgi:hypothetical protein